MKVITMQELFLYGTFWFWVLTAAAIVITFLFSESQNGIGGTISLIVYVALLQQCGDINPLTYIWQHPLISVGWLAIYFVIGLIWASIKWVLYIQDQDIRKDDVFRDFKEGNKIQANTTFIGLTQDQKDAFDKALKSRSLSRKAERFRDHLGDYARWLGFWLFNMVYTALNDFVRRIARAIAKSVSRKMQAISDRINSKWTD